MGEIRKSSLRVIRFDSILRASECCSGGCQLQVSDIGWDRKLYIC